LENVIIKFVADTSGLEPAIKQLELLGKISKDDAAAFAQVNNEQKEFIQNLNKSTTEMGKLSSEVDGLMAEIQAGVMEGFADHLAEVTSESKKAGKGFKSMKAELKELKAQIASGSLGEKELREATKRASQLTDEIGDVNDKVKALASDTKRIDAVVTAFSGIAAAASVAAGATALFGTENKQMAEAAQKAQAAMALLVGIQEIATIVTTENALKTFVLDGAQKAVAVSAKIMGGNIAAGAALATGGLTLLLAGIAYLVTEIMFAEDETEKLEKKFATLGANNEIIDKNNTIRAELIKDARERELALLKQSYKEQKSDLMKSQADGALIEENTILLFKKFKQDEADINDKYNKQKADADKAAREKAAQDKKIADNKALQDLKAANDKSLQDRLRQIREEMAANQLAIESSTSITEQAAYFEKLTQLKKEQFFLTQDFTDNELILKYDQFDKEYTAFVRMLVDKKYAQDEYYDADLEAWAAAAQKKYDDEKAAAAKTAAEDKIRREQAIKEYTKLALSSAQTLSDTIFTINQQNRDAETASILESLSMRKDAELANKNLTDAQRLQIEERYAQQEAQIKQRAWEAQKQAATMQAIINGALTIGNILATVPGGPLNPATIASLAAAAIATGAQIAIIQNAQPPKFADGGMVGGQLHSSGGTLIEAERGEYVINRQSTSDYLPSLKVLNSGEVEPTFANNILTALANGTFDLAAQFQTKQSASSDGINYDKLDRIMAKHKSNLNVNIDEQGLTTFLLKENSRVEFRNKKMRYRA
jgi:hypothetical protein